MPWRNIVLKASEATKRLPKGRAAGAEERDDSNMTLVDSGMGRRCAKLAQQEGARPDPRKDNAIVPDRGVDFLLTLTNP
jgi:hypothetical protein